MRKFIGKCDNCNHDLYDDDLYYEGKIGNLDFTLCDRCCTTHNLPEPPEESEEAPHSEWISVKERLPEKSGYYITATKYIAPNKYGVPVLSRYIDKVYYSAEQKVFNPRYEIEAAYWMPIPACPDDPDGMRRFQ